MAVADRSRCWFFTFDLKANDTSVAASQLQALSISPVRIARIQKASIISFSFSADGSPDIKGYISGGSMLRATVQAWLTNPAISNLQLHAISDRIKDELIVSFLWDSALPATVGTAGESAAGAGRRVRLDTLTPSDEPRMRSGRKPKNPALPPPVGRPQPRPGALTSSPAAAAPRPDEAGAGVLRAMLHPPPLVVQRPS